MGLVLAGIDEAGYGPMLGPLTIGLSVFRVEKWAGKGADAVPNLWTLLDRGVCREPGRGGKGDSRGRIAIADSKQLKLANSVKSTHPLVHLERGVLGMLRIAGPKAITDDVSLLAALSAKLGDHPYYGGEPIRLPLAQDSGSLAIAGNVAAGAFGDSGVSLLGMRCRLVPEDEFNHVIRERGNKAATSAGAIAEHMRHVWERWGQVANDGGDGKGGGGEGADRLGIVCDRLGGRASYGDFLRWALKADVEVVEESDTRSRYIVSDGVRRAGVAFVVGADGAHLPVALASMIAKYVRELCMLRFNRYWAGIAAGAPGMSAPRPTAGYAQDARRWLDEAKPLLAGADLARLVRIA